ncbi:YlbF family regulator [Konateibacter massiliensis]|uniref:YlbF family regulator n=1 Tax=Konateibacter massiliensis TaxID=2002841 RepID=UPI000C156CF5|nr:YlbF family regulator [Konateibacter massiliensis]
MEEDKEKSDDFTDYHGSIGDVMNQVLQCTDSLADAIVKSEEYRAYNEAKEAIHGNTELAIRLNEYRLRSFQLQSYTDTEDYFDELDMLEQEFADMKKDEKVMDFLAAELKLCKMIQEINMTIVKLVDLELKF